MLPKKLKKVISSKKPPPSAPLRPLVLVQKLEQEAQIVSKKPSSKAKRILAFFKLKKKKSGAISAEYVVVELEDGRSSTATVSTKARANSFSSSTRSGSAPPPLLASAAVNLPIAAAFCTEPRRYTIENPSKALRPTIPLSSSVVLSCRTEVPRSRSLTTEAHKDDVEAPTPAIPLSVTSRSRDGLNLKPFRLSAASLPAIPSQSSVDCARSPSYPVNVYLRNSLNPFRLSAKTLSAIASSSAFSDSQRVPASSAAFSTVVKPNGHKPLLLSAGPNPRPQSPAPAPAPEIVNKANRPFRSRIPRLKRSINTRSMSLTSVTDGSCPYCGSSTLETKAAAATEPHFELQENTQSIAEVDAVIEYDVEAFFSTDDERTSEITKQDAEGRAVSKGEMIMQTDPLGAHADINPSAIMVKSTAESGMQTEPEVEHVSKNPNRTLVDASTQTDVDDHILYSHRLTQAPGPAPAPAPLPPPPPPPPLPPKTSLSRKFFRRADVPTDTNAKASAPGNAKVSSESTGGNYLSELKDRLARRNARTTTLSVYPSQTRNSTRRSSSFTKFAQVKMRRNAPRKDENAKPEEEGELLRLFRQNKANGGRRIALGALDPNTSGASSNTTNKTTTRKLRRIVVPPVQEGAVSSRNPQIQNELERLRAQAKVGGAGGGGSRSCDKEKQKKNVKNGLENPIGTKL